LIQFLLHFDTQLFRLINISWQNPVFDWIMPVLTSQVFLNFFLLFIAILTIALHKKKGAWVVLFLVLTIGLSDQLSSFGVKPLVGRTRPCHVVEGVHLLANCTDSYSFPSSHATNSFAAAMLISFYFPGIRVALFIFAFLVSYSRPYVGVHYPGDIIGGAILGMLCAWLIIYLQQKYFKKVTE
jgi:undecaprenyl-diphosphatase